MNELCNSFSILSLCIPILFDSFIDVDHKAPALLAAFLFLLNICLAVTLLPVDIEENHCSGQDSNISSKVVDKNSNSVATIKKNSDDSEGTKSKKSFWDNVKSCYSSQSLASVVICLLVFSWIFRATSYSSMGSYYEDMYGVEPHTRGYIQSYQRVCAFIVQSLLLQPFLARAGGERRAILIAALVLASGSFLETQQNFLAFLCFICPSIALSTTVMRVSLRSLLTQLAPEDAIFSVFAAMDVLQNASGKILILDVCISCCNCNKLHLYPCLHLTLLTMRLAVTVPFYRAFLFRFLNRYNYVNTDTYANHTMDGDPNPVAWVLCAGFHWVVAFFCMIYLLHPTQKVSKSTITSKKDL